MSQETIEVRDASPSYELRTPTLAVPAGYKQTDVGVIPVDWKIAAVQEFAEVGRGRVISHKEIAKSSPIYPVYSSQTSNNGVMGYLDTFDFSGEYITWTTDGANAGTVFHRDGRFNCTNVCGTIKVFDQDARYVSRILSEIAPKHVSRHLGNPKLMNDVMKRVKVPLPPIEEQRAIATALSDVDALLEGLDRLIAKKRDLKQAAMQQLLTGQTRLPGFEGEWEIKRFDEVLMRLNTKANQIKTNDYRPTGMYPVIDQGKEPVVGFSDKENKIFRCPEGGVIVFGDHTCIVKFVDFDFLVGADGTQIIKGKLGQIVSLYAYQLKYRGIEPTGYNRHFSILKEKEFAVPNEAEQSAIAAVLSDMDAEIEALEQRRTKTAALKQAMMQELLTGRTRLVKPENSKEQAC